MLKYECSKCGATPPALVEELLTAFMGGALPEGITLTPSLMRLLMMLFSAEDSSELGVAVRAVVNAARNPDEPAYAGLSAINRQAVITAVSMLAKL